MLPKVSVIIPNYNHAQFLPRRIESVINQTFRDIEIIILDDRSTDNSREIIESYAVGDSRISTHFNTTNTGSPFRQWRKGIELAKGEFIWIAESDDYAEFSLLEKLLCTIEKDTNRGVAYCQSHFVDSSDKIIGNHIRNLAALDSTLWQSDFCIEGAEAIGRFMVIINIIPNASAAIFRKSLVSNFDWEKQFQFKLAGDRYFWVTLLSQSKLCFVSESMNYFRVSINTQRDRYMYSPIYLKEIADNAINICNKVKVSQTNKTKAIKQWYRNYKNAQTRGKQLGFLFYYNIFKSFIRMISIYFC